MNVKRAVRSLAWTIFRGLAPAVLCLVCFLAMSNYYAARSQIVEGVRLQMETLARQAAGTLAVFFHQREEDARILVESPVIHDYLKNLEYGLLQEAEQYRQEMAWYFSRLAQRVGVYALITYVDERGRETAAGSPKGPVMDLARPRAGIPMPVPGKVLHTGIPTGYARFIQYASGVQDDWGKPKGAVVLTCNLDHVRSLLDQARVGRQGLAFLVDRAGNRLLVPPGTPEGRLAAQAPIPGTPWAVQLLAQPEEFLGPLRRVQEWFGALALAAGMLMVLWIRLQVRKLVAPIEVMAEGTRRIAQGDLDYTFKPPAIAELQTLGNAFNEMARSLKERNKQLNARIYQLSALREMDVAVLERQSEEGILKTCLEAVARGLGYDRTAVYWIDPRTREIVGRYLYSAQGTVVSESRFQRRRVALGEPDILNEVVDTRKPVLVLDPALDPRVNQEFARESQTREFVLAPIPGKDRVLGVLAADTYHTGRHLEESDREALGLFANAVGLAVENASLFKSLAESEARYRTVLENSPVAILGLSQSHHITTWNRGAEEIFGYPAREMLGKPITALFPEETEGEVQKLLAEILRQGAARDHPVQGMAKGTRRLDLSLSWAGSKPDYWLNKEWTVVIRDVTEAKKLQQQLIHSEKLSVVGKLISGIAHELNNPLQGVVGYAQLLEDAQKARGAARSPKDVATTIQRIAESAALCRKIVDNLLLFVRHGEAPRSPVRLERAIRDSLSLLNYRLAKAANIEMRVRVARDLPPVQGDLRQIQQVLVNLINNSCDAMARYRGAKRLSINVGALEGRVRVEVSDSGPGVAEEAKGRVFEPFFTMKPESRGTGLGLFICRQIIEDHGGRIGFASPPGQGATFWLELPAAKPSLTPPPRRPRSLARIPGRRVLLVDDEAAVLSYLREVFEAEQDLPETASTLEEALLKASERTFHLVVADVFLTDGNGLDLYEKWMQRSGRPRPPFLFLTGDIVNAELEDLIESRGVPLCYKPVDLKAFRQAVRTLLSGKSLGV